MGKPQAYMGERFITEVVQLQNSIAKLLEHHDVMERKAIKSNPYSFSEPLVPLSPDPRIKRYSEKLGSIQR